MPERAASWLRLSGESAASMVRQASAISAARRAAVLVRSPARLRLAR